MAEQKNYRLEDKVVMKIAGIAVDETEGLRTNTAAPDALEGALDRARGNRNQSKGVSAEISEDDSRANIEVSVAVEYGKQIPQLAETARKNVIQRVEQLAGMKVNEVNIVVNDVFDPEAEAERERREREDGSQGQREVESPERPGNLRREVR